VLEGELSRRAALKACLVGLATAAVWPTDAQAASAVTPSVLEAEAAMPLDLHGAAGACSGGLEAGGCGEALFELEGLLW
jgi:hypothetical protein